MERKKEILSKEDLSKVIGGKNKLKTVLGGTIGFLEGITRGVSGGV